MDDNLRYVIEQNVTRFYDLLADERDPARRYQLQRMMVGEESRYGTLSEQLVYAERWLEKSAARITRHAALREKGVGNGDDPAAWDRTGENLHEIQNTIRDFCDTLRQQMARFL